MIQLSVRVNAKYTSWGKSGGENMKKYEKPTIEIERLYTMRESQQLQAAEQNMLSSEKEILEQSFSVSAVKRCDAEHKHDEKR